MQLRRTTTLALLGCVTVAASVLAASAPASAHGSWPPVKPGTPAVIAGGLSSPLSLAVDEKGNSYLSQNFAGLVSKVSKNGKVTTLASAPGLETSAVSYRNGTVYYSQLAFDHSSAVLMALPKGGTPKQIGDIQAYEAKANPDGKTTYGFTDLPQACLDQIPADALAPGKYTGIVDTHPYASLAVRSGVYIADAGANAILKVGYNGKVTTTAVLPPAAPVTVTADLAGQAGFPSCVVGYKYRFESVPTDVELGPDGYLYVTSLPGGPEDPSLGARGVVYRVSPWSGRSKVVATGFVGTTGLAVSPKGTIYVAELFGGGGSGQVSVVKHGVAKKFLTLAGPAAIEISGKKLYVTTGAAAEEPTASLTVVPLKSRWHH